LSCQVVVYRNDEFEIDELQQYDKIVLSPGPGIPDEAGLLKNVIRKYAMTKSILGICLGQQAIAEVFGGTLTNLKKAHHGVASDIQIIAEDESLFNGLPKNISVGRYHSWTVNRELPENLEATSLDIKGEIMSLRHRFYNVRGVQFHPESVLTPNGMQILNNWVN
jgi:anthranilate synthase component 2